MTSQKAPVRLFATLGLIIGVLNFVFCMYPPFQMNPAKCSK